MGYEDVDYCLRAWEAGRAVRYEPAVDAHPPRVAHPRHRRRASASAPPSSASGSRWGSWFDERPVRTADGALRIIYVTEDTGVGGGHRDIFEHLNRLAERGHSVELFSLEGAPEWFPLDVHVRTFEDYDELAAALARGGRDQGRHLVGHRRRRCGAGRCGAAGRSSSSRTSRPRTTPADDYRAGAARRAGAGRATARSSAYMTISARSQERAEGAGPRRPSWCRPASTSTPSAARRAAPRGHAARARAAPTR